MTGLRLLGVLVTPNYPFGSTALRFAHRFSAFAVFPTPTLLTAEEFRRSNHLGDCEPAMLFKYATECFKLAVLATQKLHKFEVENPDGVLDELLELSKVASANIAWLSQASRTEADQSGATFEMVLDYNLHEHFPVVTLVSKVELAAQRKRDKEKKMRKLKILRRRVREAK